jgi:hypothetical protein
MSAGVLTVLRDSRWFLQSLKENVWIGPSRQMPGWYLQVGHSHFLAYYLINCGYYPVIRCNICWVVEGVVDPVTVVVLGATGTCPPPGSTEYRILTTSLKYRWTINIGNYCRELTSSVPVAFVRERPTANKFSEFHPIRFDVVNEHDLNSNTNVIFNNIYWSWW